MAKDGHVPTRSGNRLIDTRMIIDDVMRRYPETVSVFLQFGMDCYGCSMARFESVKDGAAAYHVDLHLLTQALDEAARKTKTGFPEAGT